MLFSKKYLEPTFIFDIMGMSYQKKEIESIAMLNPEYDYSDAQLNDLSREKVYRYLWSINSVKLVPEPKNKADKNAIMVVINGAKVGYVPSDKTDVVKNYLKRKISLSCSLHGGKWKEAYFGKYERKEYSYYGTITINLLS